MPKQGTARRNATAVFTIILKNKILASPTPATCAFHDSQKTLLICQGLLNLSTASVREIWREPSNISDGVGMIHDTINLVSSEEEEDGADAIQPLRKKSRTVLPPCARAASNTLPHNPQCAAAHETPKTPKLTQEQLERIAKNKAEALRRRGCATQSVHTVHSQSGTKGKDVFSFFSHPPAASASASAMKKNEDKSKPPARLFVDLDGVLADFDEGVKQVTGRTPEQQSPQEMWRKLGAVAKPGFFANLRWTQQCGEELWNAVKRSSPSILTGLPRGHYYVFTRVVVLVIGVIIGGIITLYTQQKGRQQTITTTK
jgi:hypothetical protein